MTQNLIKIYFGKVELPSDFHINDFLNSFLNVNMTEIQNVRWEKTKIRQSF